MDEEGAFSKEGDLDSKDGKDGKDVKDIKDLVSTAAER